MPDIPPTPDGEDYFVLGADQFTSPQRVAAGKYIDSMNTLSRGGIVQTRPGSRSMFTMPEGYLQGAVLFVPSSGVPQIVFAVSGNVYASAYPFQTYTPLYNIQFNAASRFIAWAVCMKSTEYDSQGVQYVLDSPYTVLIMQDGTTRAAYWDGTNSGHLNPTTSKVYDANGNIITQVGMDQTPVGLWMKWSNNRLWVSRGNQIFASDLGDPLKFVDMNYLNEIRSFYLPDNCTGITETTDQQGIVCFTSQTGTFLQSSIQDRTTWSSTPGFQKTILTNIGCSAPRSIVQQYGLIWWYSAKGLVSQNDALSANITSKLEVQDNAMFNTKEYMSWDLSGIASCNHENLILTSVPYADIYNTRTMVLDQSPVGGIGLYTSYITSWASFWTGWRPVEWARGVVNGEERCFCASVDYDGKNRMWELFTQDKTDNGLPITCWVQSREHLFGNRDYKKFKFAEVEFKEIVGDVSVGIYVAGVKGAFQLLGSKEVVSTIGQVYSDNSYASTDKIAGSTAQTRIIRTQETADASDCNANCIESDNSGLVDRAFSIMVAWSGVAGVSAYRIFTDTWTNSYSGACEPDETGTRLLGWSGCGTDGIFLSSTPFPLYTSTRTYSQIDPDTTIAVSFTATQTSHLSQADADRKADLAAKSYVWAQIGTLV